LKLQPQETGKLECSDSTENDDATWRLQSRGTVDDTVGGNERSVFMYLNLNM